MSDAGTAETQSAKPKPLSGYQKRKRRREKLLAEAEQLKQLGVTLTAPPPAAVVSGAKVGSPITRLDITLGAIDEMKRSDAIGLLGRIIRAEEVGFVGVSRDGKKLYDTPKLDQRLVAMKILAQWAGADRPVEAERNDGETERSREELVREVLAMVRRLADVAAPAATGVEGVDYDVVPPALPTSSDRRSGSPDGVGS